MLRLTPALGETAYGQLLEPVAITVRGERDAGPGEVFQLWTDVPSLGHAVAAAPSGGDSARSSSGDGGWHAETAARHGTGEHRVALVALATGE
jgi:hypothetical protein